MKLAEVLPRSIVARTTLAIVLLAMILGSLFAAGAAWRVQHNEQRRLQAQLDALLATVQSTVAIAAFVRDAALASEIASGLLSNEIVGAVRIRSGDDLLHEQARHPMPGAAQDSAWLTMSRKLHSPFDANEIVGDIRLDADPSAIRSQAWVYTRMVVLLLGMQVILIAGGVAWTVYNLITRPIKGISDELHRLEVRTGMRLRVPPLNQLDEIGRLVADVNGLIGSLSALIETERALRLQREASERRLAMIFEKAETGIFEVGTEGLLQNWNPAFERTLGTPGEPPLLQDLLGAQWPPVEALMRDSAASGTQKEADLQLPPHRPAQWVEMSLTPVGADRLQGMVNDITERKRVELDARRLATRDTLTGLLNRGGFDVALQAAFDQCRGNPGIVTALLAMDLDYFKQVNDNHGHEAGDRVLRHVAHALQSIVRRTDVVARPGGDEFTVLLIGIDSVDQARTIADQIVAELRQPIDVGTATVQIGASVGVAMLDAEDSSPGATMRRADEAMYAAKQAGRCCVRIAGDPPAHEPAGVCFDMNEGMPCSTNR